MDFSLDSIKSGISSIGDSIGSKISGVLDPSNARLSIAGLLKGGRRVPEAPYEAKIGFAESDGKVGIKDDWRMRINVSESSGIFNEGGGDLGVLQPLYKTFGVVFPYTPTVSVNYSAGYSSQKSTHSNYPAFFYEASEVQEIQLSAPFSVQNAEEGQYLLAAIYFFRATTKMFYGQSPNAGNPPPIVFLNGYGSHYFPNVPCIVTGFTHSMPDEADYIEIPVGTGSLSEYGRAMAGFPTTRLPTISDIQVRLQPVYSRRTIADFDLEAFARGGLLDKGFI